MNALAKLAALASRFVALQTFGSAAVYQPAAGGAVAINVVFAREFQRSDPVNIEFSNSGPAAFIRETDAVSAGPEDFLVVEEEVFQVAEVQKGAAGLHVLILTETTRNVLVSEAGEVVLTEDGKLIFV